MAVNSLVPHSGRFATFLTERHGLTAEDARILAEMFDAGHRAIARYSEPDTGACGYASLTVCVSRPMAVHFCGAGFRRVAPDCCEKTIICPGYQSLDAHEYVAKAMAESLTRNGLEAFVSGRLD